MRVALVSTLSTPVRRVGANSVEAVVWLLGHELRRLGHDVTVFAGAGSEVGGPLVATVGSPYGAGDSPGDWHVCEWMNLCRAVERSAEFDVVHSHAYLFGLPFGPLARAPMLHTTHLHGYDEYARQWRAHPDARVSAISRAQWADHPDLRPTGVVHHGVDDAQFTFRPAPDDYVCWLGRFVPHKGALEAVTAARALGVRLRLAGPPNAYFDAAVRPLVDGRAVEYVGEVAGAERDRLLGGARALLYPLSEPEPFGLVLAEAMLCGTPVAALRIGAVPELVDEGVTGACADGAGGLPDALARALALDRGAVRRRAVARFSGARMARDYARLYERLAGDPRDAAPEGPR